MPFNTSFMMPSLRSEESQYNLPGLLNDDEDNLKKMLARLQLSGGLTKVGDKYTNSTIADGRVGYNLPIGQGDLNFGLSGAASQTKVNAPNFHKTFNQSSLTGLDLSYQLGDARLAGNLMKGGDYDVNYSKGNDTFGLRQVKHQKLQDQSLPQEMQSPVDLKRLLQLYYMREF